MKKKSKRKEAKWKAGVVAAGVLGNGCTMDPMSADQARTKSQWLTCDKSGCHNCFLAGTPILTARGLVAIESIMEGDLVIARNPIGNDNAAQLVRSLFRDVAEKYLEIAVQGEVIRVTTEHPFRVREPGGEVWRPASALSKADRLITAKGEEVQIESVRLVEEAAPIFNFEVAHWHNYYVGANSILVHNQSMVDVSVGWSSPDGTYSQINGSMATGSSTTVTTGSLGGPNGTGGSMSVSTSAPGVGPIGGQDISFGAGLGPDSVGLSVDGNGNGGFGAPDPSGGNGFAQDGAPNSPGDTGNYGDYGEPTSNDQGFE